MENSVNEFGYIIVTSVLVVLLALWILTHIHNVIEFVFLMIVLGGVVLFSMKLSDQIERKRGDFLMISKKTAIKNNIGGHDLLTNRFIVRRPYRKLISNLKEVERVSSKSK